MINEQVFLWIIKNRQIYFSQSLQISLHNVFLYNFDVEFMSIMKIILVEFSKQSKNSLKKQEAVMLDDFICFWAIRSADKIEQHSTIMPQYTFSNNISHYITQINHNKAPSTKKESSPKMALKISNNLNLPQDIIQELLLIFVKAINNLLHLGHQINITLSSFCKIKVSKKKGECIFAKTFIKELNSRQQENKENNRLFLCVTKKCQTKNQFNTTSLAKKAFQQKWEQTKQGNLFDKPSLIELQKHFDKGKLLHLKYQSQMT